MTDNEFLLQDRLQKIRQIINQYGENNFYLSFSGGKDSTVLSWLLDKACPGNTIPRVYANTGIEYRLILDFVEKEKARGHPWELVVLQPRVPIKQMLEQEGYPFKSKAHAKWVERFHRIGRSEGVAQYLGERTDKKPWSSQNTCPAILKYQFSEDFNAFKISDKCCVNLKEKPLDKYSKENGKLYGIVGIMPDEGGRRTIAKCIAFKGKHFLFQPLVPVTKEWEDGLIKTYHIDICDIYKPPYNFNRTGCKGCPFALHLQDELDTLEKYFPNERKQCEAIWKPVYDEYRRLGYRLRKKEVRDGV